MDVTEVDLTEWDEALPADGFDVFHRPAALSVLETHTDADLRLLVGYKGEQPIGMLPAFVTERLVGQTVMSPPPSMGVPKLGPLLSTNSPKQRKFERANDAFATGVRETLSLEDRATLFRFVCSPSFRDPRPYIWANDAVEMSFTYRLDLADTSAEDALAAASKSLRRSVRDCRDLDISVSVEGMDATRTVYEQTKARYEEQDRGFTLSWPYVRDLVTELDEYARTYVVRGPDGEILSGIIALFSNDDALFWLGGTRADHDGTSVNAILHWAIVEDVIADPPVESVTGYDLMGANTERLARYKSKFGADLVPYYVIEPDGPSMDVAKALYTRVAR